MQRAGWLGIVVLACVACGSSETDVIVRGQVTYSDYSTGDILLKLVEDETEDCGLFSCSSKTPGDTKTTARLKEPGPFSLSASLQGSKMHLLAYALGQAADPWDCDAGAMKSLSVASHSDVDLVLVAGSCPALE